MRDSSEREWIEPRLQQLLGLVERSSSDREDLFSAWRRFFEHLAEQATQQGNLIEVSKCTQRRCIADDHRHASGPQTIQIAEIVL